MAEQKEEEGILTKIYFFLIGNIEAVSEEEFSEIYAAELDFTTAFSDGTVVEVKEGGNQIQVNYEDCVEYCKLVKKTRMMESITQVRFVISIWRDIV